mmetsp:Transcript_17485/g.48650  ORF Transcript_17485/g.48650 Transcript_17485/m.48650 type:complete len:109 (+) Transcript_17485:1709-2035(+)|eukprot:728872-Pelagomonas_calceolata.AAC.8
MRGREQLQRNTRVAPARSIQLLPNCVRGGSLRMVVAGMMVADSIGGGGRDCAAGKERHEEWSRGSHSEGGRSRQGSVAANLQPSARSLSRGINGDRSFPGKQKIPGGS